MLVLLGNDRLLEELKVDDFPSLYFVNEDGTIAGVCGFYVYYWPVVEIFCDIVRASVG